MAEAKTGGTKSALQFGALLREAREMRGVTIPDVALATKIQKRYLEAIESDRFDLLPAGVFTRMFIRSYAQHLGLDPEQILLEFTLFQREQGEEETEPEPVEDPVRARGARTGLVMMVLFLAMGAGVFWGVHRLTGSASGPQPPAPAKPREEPGARTPVPPVPEAKDPVAQEPVVPPPPPDRGILALEFTAPCWIRVRVDGTVRHEGLVPAGAHMEWDGGLFELVIGDPSAVKASFGNRPVVLGGSAGVRLVRTLAAQDLATQAGIVDPDPAPPTGGQP